MTPEQAGAADASANREAWLQRAVEAMKPWLEEQDGVELPPVRVSVGWPSARGLSDKRRVVGECWHAESAEDGVAQVFISPVRGRNESADALVTLLHELIHAVCGLGVGHKGRFVAIAREAGLVRPWTSSTAGEELADRVEGLLERIGPMPSAAIIGGRGADAPKKQSTRMLKVECPDCGCTARMSQKWIDLGLPTCACGIKMEVPE